MRWDSMCTQQLGLQVFWPVPVCTTRKALLLANLHSPCLSNCPTPCFLPSGPQIWSRTWRSLNRKIAGGSLASREPSVPRTYDFSFPNLADFTWSGRGEQLSLEQIRTGLGERSRANQGWAPAPWRHQPAFLSSPSLPSFSPAVTCLCSAASFPRSPRGLHGLTHRHQPSSRPL